MITINPDIIAPPPRQHQRQNLPHQNLLQSKRINRMNTMPLIDHTITQTRIPGSRANKKRISREKSGNVSKIQSLTLTEAVNIRQNLEQKKQNPLTGKKIKARRASFTPIRNLEITPIQGTRHVHQGLGTLIHLDHTAYISTKYTL